MSKFYGELNDNKAVNVDNITISPAQARHNINVMLLRSQKELSVQDHIRFTNAIKVEQDPQDMKAMEASYAADERRKIVKDMIAKGKSEKEIKRALRIYDNCV